MTISDGIKLKGYPAFIPNSSRDDLPQFFKERGFKRGAEIGVFRGEYTEIIAKSGLQIYAIDPWDAYSDYGDPKSQRWLTRYYDETRNRLAKYDNAIIIRDTSMNALELFEDESLDFVYIDGNHHFKYVAEDIYEWWRKVKKGGVVCGHDYAYFKHRMLGTGCQVREVVDAFSKAYDLNFWVLGNRKDKVRDRYRSWMFIKT